MTNLKQCKQMDNFTSFIPRREMRSISSRGPIVFTYDIFWVSKRTFKKKSHPSSVILAEFFPQNVLFDGVGWDGVG